MATSYQILQIKGRDLPLKVIRERRANVRAALGKEYILIRMPIGISRQEEEKHWQYIRNWLNGLTDHEIDPLIRYQGRDYRHGDTLVVGQRKYLLDIKRSARKTSGAKLRHGQIFVDLSDDLTVIEQRKVLSTLISRVVAKDFLPIISERTHLLNQRYFGKELKKVSLKNNHSNWGSCSSSGNINFSTRLLFAPQDVIDYVIIHELAHLIEHNHSPAFWQHVARAMPNYKEKEAWLKAYGRACYF